MKTMNFILRTCDLRTFLESCTETVNLVVPEKSKRGVPISLHILYISLSYKVQV